MTTFDPDALTGRRAELEEQMGAPGFWDDQAEAARVSTEHARVTRKLDSYESLRKEVDDAAELLELDSSLEAEVAEQIAPVRDELARLQEEALFNGEYDAGDAVVTVTAGTGGTDAQDWAEMLLRMYLRWTADRGFQTELVEASPGEEAGLKSATLTVRGENAYGLFKAERGVHRLVRLSPFDSAHRRHTAFAQVVVAPLLPDSAEVEIDEGDLRIDTYRASGAGGQHVNKTDSAVRITHLPTGIVVQCQNERSQASNKQTAMRILRSRLAELAEEEREAELARERGGEGRRRLRQPDPLLRAAPVPDGQGPPHGLRGRQRPGRARRRARRLRPGVPPRPRHRQGVGARPEARIGLARLATEPGARGAAANRALRGKEGPRQLRPRRGRLQGRAPAVGGGSAAGIRFCGFPLRGNERPGLGYNPTNLNRSGLGGRSPFERSLPVMDDLLIPPAESPAALLDGPDVATTNGANVPPPRPR